MLKILFNNIIESYEAFYFKLCISIFSVFSFERFYFLHLAMNIMRKSWGLTFQKKILIVYGIIIGDIIIYISFRENFNNYLVNAISLLWVHVMHAE